MLRLRIVAVESRASGVKARLNRSPYSGADHYPLWRPQFGCSLPDVGLCRRGPARWMLNEKTMSSSSTQNIRVIRERRVLT